MGMGMDMGMLSLSISLALHGHGHGRKYHSCVALCQSHPVPKICSAFRTPPLRLHS